jgi:diguanylate cyclase (GGDEF)-like protein
MPSPSPAPKSHDHLKRGLLMAIMALSLVSSGAGWWILEAAGRSSLALRATFALNLLFHPVFFVITWRRLLPLRVVEMACVLFAAGLCWACMAARLYWPAVGGEIDLAALCLWIPVIYVFTFTVAGHRSSLKISLAIYAVFALTVLPYVALHLREASGNLTLQLLVVSAILVAALYFFSSYQHRFQLAQLDLDQLARLANTDALTGLANRRRMSEAIEAELLRFARYGHAFSVILIDIDHFKAVNDRHGHRTGDEVLVALAAHAQQALRDVDMLGRWGGEEFLIILPETAQAQALGKAADLCVHVAGQPLAGHAVTISCGAASVRAGDNAGALLQRADEALYAAKRGGRNQARGM